jgi:hypothetical protein
VRGDEVWGGGRSGGVTSRHAAGEQPHKRAVVFSSSSVVLDPAPTTYNDVQAHGRDHLPTCGRRPGYA